jgi:hypothetical protein
MLYAYEKLFMKELKLTENPKSEIQLTCLEGMTRPCRLSLIQTSLLS